MKGKGPEGPHESYYRVEPGFRPKDKLIRLDARVNCCSPTPPMALRNCRFSVLTLRRRRLGSIPRRKP